MKDSLSKLTTQSNKNHPAEVDEHRETVAANYLGNHIGEAGKPNTQDNQRSTQPIRRDGETVAALVSIGSLPETKEPDGEGEDAASRDLPSYIIKAKGVEPDSYSAPFTKRCFWCATRFVRTTTETGDVSHAVKRMLCKSKRCPFCYRWLHATVYRAKLATVPLHRDALFITYTQDQTRLNNLGISKRAAQTIIGKQLSDIREEMQGLLGGSEHWTWFGVMESHRSGHPHKHAVYRSQRHLDYWWSIGADKLLGASGEFQPTAIMPVAPHRKRGRLKNVPDGGYWVTSMEHFFCRAFNKKVAGTGKWTLDERRKQRYWDWEKVARYHALQGLSRGVDVLKKKLRSLLKERVRKSKNREGREHLLQRYQEQLSLVMGDVPVEGCLCHPSSRYYPYRASHNIEDEYRAILAEEVIQPIAYACCLGDVTVIPVFDSKETVEYLIKEMTKEAQQNFERPRDVKITSGGRKSFFREWCPEDDSNTYDQVVVKGWRFGRVLHALKAQGVLVGKAGTVVRRGDGSDIPTEESFSYRTVVSQDVELGTYSVINEHSYDPSQNPETLATVEHLTEWLPIITRNLRWDDVQHQYRLDCTDTRSWVIVRGSGHYEVYTFWPSNIIERTRMQDGELSAIMVSLDELRLQHLDTPRLRRFGQRDYSRPDDVHEVFRRLREDDPASLLGLVTVLAVQHDGSLLRFGDDGVATQRFNYKRGEWEDSTQRSEISELFPQLWPQPIAQPGFDDVWGCLDDDILEADRF